MVLVNFGNCFFPQKWLLSILAPISLGPQDTVMSSFPLSVFQSCREIRYNVLGTYELCSSFQLGSFFAGAAASYSVPLFSLVNGPALLTLLLL